MRAVALLTPTFSADIERFDLLCESIDRYVVGFTRHYALVNDGDLPLFTKYNNSRRIIVPASSFLPRWSSAAPRGLSRIAGASGSRRRSSVDGCTSKRS